MLQDHDEPILKHLEDIKVKFSDPGQPMVSGNHWSEDVASPLVVILTLFLSPPLLLLLLFPQSFTLEFQFSANDFFTNTVLTKTYKMRSEPDESDPFSFDGPEIISCTG